jgi:hypothetical protein
LSGQRAVLEHVVNPAREVLPPRGEGDRFEGNDPERLPEPLEAVSGREETAVG